MGFIKKIFGGIFALLANVLKLFKIGKSDYYVELDTTKTVDPTPANQPAPVSVEGSGQAQTQAVEKPAKVQAQQPVNRLEPSPATASAPAAPKPDQSQPVDTFAPRFLVPNARGGRRRPGPSLSPFRDLAREVNPSLRG
jgi:predicted lipid-binding transport protein (Tim44 family)